LPGWPASPCTGQWPLTSQSYGSFPIQNNCFFVANKTPRPTKWIFYKWSSFAKPVP
jgi:hypothetical protein